VDCASSKSALPMSAGCIIAQKSIFDAWRSPVQRASNFLADRFSGGGDRIIRQVSIPLGGAVIAVPKKLAHDHQRRSAGNPDTREGMPQIVEANVWQVHLYTELRPDR